MAFPRKLLHGDEELILDLRPHWLFLIPSAMALVVAIAFGIWVFTADLGDTADTILTILAILGLVGGLGWFAVRYAGWAFTNFVLTSDRVISRTGILKKTGVEIPLDRVNTVFFNQTIFERMAGAGDLGIESAGERGSQTFGNVRKPEVIQREIYVAMEANENRKFDRIGNRPAAGGGGLSVAEQLEKLHELAEQGAITPEEYEAQKAKLLG